MLEGLRFLGGVGGRDGGGIGGGGGATTCEIDEDSNRLSFVSRFFS
jgi:hypothetical protein